MTSPTLNLLYTIATSATCLTGLFILTKSPRSRRLRSAAAALLILIGSAIIALGPPVRRHGWPAAIPTTLLVSGWLVTPDEWISNDLLSNPMLAELHRRRNAGEMDITTAAAWARRVDARRDQYGCCFYSPPDNRLTSSDRICYLTAGTTTLTGVALLLWSLRGDRARGRKRCPRCWYNMLGAPSLTCPECGHAARRPSRLARTRRRWRPAFAACSVLALAAATACIPTIREKGWRGSIPDAVLVTVWPIEPDEWIDHTLGDASDPLSSTLEELNRRIGDDELSVWASSWWAARIDASLRSRMPFLEFPHESLQALHLDLGDTLTALQDREYEIGLVDSHDDLVEVMRRVDHHDSIRRVITNMIDPENWIDGGGEIGRTVRVGDHLFVLTAANNIDAITALVAAITPGTPAEMRSLAPDDWAAARDTLSRLDRTPVHLPSDSPTAHETAAAITAATGIPVDLDSTDLAIHELCDQPIFTGRADTTAAEALDRLTDWCSLRPHSHLIFTWTAWRGAVHVLDDYASPSRTLIRTYDISDLLRDPSIGAPECQTVYDREWHICRLITATIEPHLWVDNGGEIGVIQTLSPALIIQATARQHVQIEELLTQVRVKHAQGRAIR